MLRSLDLFSGYGGIALALREWCDPIAYVEIEEYAQRVIAERMADGSLPRAAILGDVKNIEGEVGDCDIITGGFPCQDISAAGLGKGLEGERSSLFFEIARLAEEIQPRFIFLENVPAIRTRGLFAIATTLSEMGYDLRWTSVSAEYVGAPHKRERWFLLAHSNREPIGIQSRRLSRSQRSDATISELDGEKGIVANSERLRCELRREPEGRSQGEITESTPTHKSCLIPDSRTWEVEPELGRVADGIAYRVDRIRALGNGVVPEQARVAFKRLMWGMN